MHKSILSFILFLASLASPCKGGLRVTDLTCENLTNPVAIDNDHPHFSWINTSGTDNDVQTAYEIQIATSRKLLLSGKADVWMSGRQYGPESVMVPYGGPALAEREQYVWRVRTWNSSGKCSGWSQPARFGVGILREASFSAAYVMSADAKDETPLLHKDLTLQHLGDQAVMHVNSLGYHELYVNGKRVGEHVLQPAVSQLDRRSQIVSYDVSPYLRKGRNDIVIWLGKGWYKRDIYKARYDGPVVRAQLDMRLDGEWAVAAKTDGSWQSCTSQSGSYTDLGTWRPHEFGGERIDARRMLPDLSASSLRKAGWTPVRVVPVDGIKTQVQMFPGNKIIAELTPVSIRQVDDRHVAIDFGRNITGWLQTTLRGLSAGQKVMVRYADDANEDGSLDLGEESDLFVASGKVEDSFRNRFNHHAFRYALLECDANNISSIKALQISADVRDAASFSCSDPDINAVHDMIQRTLRCLSLSGYTVDCPHIERQGYGGDGNSSTLSLLTMQAAAPTFYNWIQAWHDVQDPDGSMPHVAPTCRQDGGGPYWCGFIIQASWRTYLMTGDDRMLRKHYPAMKRWLEYVRRYSPEGLLEQWPDTYNRGWYLGDWLAPDGIDVGDSRSVRHVNNCSVAECLDRMSGIAALLGNSADEAYFRQWSAELKARIDSTFRNVPDATYASASPLDLAYALHAGIVPDEHRQRVSDRLAELSRGKYRSHIAVGLVGVPVFSEWSTDYRQVQLMYDILKQPDYPGYLYMIACGATTTWESWNRTRSRIHNCYNGIGTWFYQALAGIRPDSNVPGYRHFYIEPQLPLGIDHVTAVQQTPYGEIKVEVSRTDGCLHLDADVPFGTTATIRLGDVTREVGSGHVKV